MTSQCEQCRNRFFIEADGSVEGMAVSCPDCGGKLAPERDQPSGSPSDGRLRNMVDPATQKDMGGNPLQEGIWATTDNGWQNRMKRDESFASVKTAAQSAQAVPQLPAGIHNGTMLALGYVGATVNGMQPGNELFMWTIQQWLPQAREGNLQPVTVTVPHDHPAYIAAAVAIIEHSSECQGKLVPVPEFKALIEGIQSGEIPPPQQAPRQAKEYVTGWHESRDQTIHVPWNMQRSAISLPLPPSTQGDIPSDNEERARFIEDPNLQNIPQDIQIGLAGVPALKGAQLALKAPKLMKGALGAGAVGAKVLQKIIKGLPDGPDAPAAPAGYTPTQAPTLHAVTHVHESFDTTPTSLDKIPNAEGTGDTHEFKDQSTDLNPENPNEDDSGVGTLTPETQQLLEEALPTILKYFVSDESGQAEPILQQLDEALEREMPGYKEVDLEDEEDREPSAVSAKVADTQGPSNPDQFKAVSEALIEQGRVEEIPHMFEAPWEYADILAEIQNSQEPPPAVEDPAQSPMPGVPGPPGGAMPPMMPAGGPPGMMPPGAQIAAAVQRHRVAADNIAPKCPHCGSHTTEIVGNNGSCRCHACGKQWDGGLEKRAEVFEHEDLHADPMPNDTQTTSPPKHDDQNEDASRTWQTTDGSPLEVGKEYELHSPKYSIPDVVRIEQVKPTELVVTLTGEYDDLEDQITIGRDEASDQEYSFIPVDGGEEPGSQDALDYMDDQAQAPRTNTEPTPSAARPFTTSWNDKLGGTKMAAPVQYPYSGPQLPDERTQEAAGHFDKAEQIYREQGWEAAKAFLDQQLGEFHEKHYPGQDSLAEVDVAGFGEQMRNEHGGDAPSMWAQNKDFQLDEGKRVAPVGDQLGWQPGGGGRGIFIDGNLHTWPVNKTPENPQGGLMHGEYINQFGNVRNVSAGFEIDPDGSVVDLGTPLSPEEQQRLKQAHPETNYGGESPAGATDFTFGSVQEDPDLAWLKEGMSMGGAPAPWQRPLEDLTGGPAFAPPVEPQSRQPVGATASAPEAGVADWLNDGTWTPSRTAGKNFTPSQQREFIDEDGEARNLDRLDLDGTHYKIRETSVQVARDGGVTRFAQPEMVREDDFALGF